MRHIAYTNAVVTGSVAYDVIMDFPSEFMHYFHPKKLHQINVSFVVNDLKKQLGGTGTNIVYNISLVSGSHVILAASVGKDAEQFFEFFRTNNIDTSLILIDKNKYTATGNVITDIKDNQIWGFYYGACEKASRIQLKQSTDAKTLLIISANHPKAFLHFQKEAIKKNIDYVYDPGMTLTWITKDDLIRGILHAQFLVGNDYEIAQIIRQTDLSMKTIKEKVEGVITTLGVDGVLFESKEKKYKIPSYTVQKVIDPTGAGDAWRGGFVGGLLEGKTIVESLIQGNALASFAVETYGTANHRPTKKQVKERMQSIKGKLA